MTTHAPDFLQGLAPDEVAAVLALGSRTTLPGGTAVFQLGAEAGSLFLVERGRVDLTLPIQVGGRHEELLVEERQPGQMVGWSALIPPHRFTLNAVAPLETELIAFPRAALLAHFAARPAVGYAVMAGVSAIIGHRLQVLQAMWLREMQRGVALRSA